MIQHIKNATTGPIPVADVMLAPGEEVKLVDGSPELTASDRDLLETGALLDVTPQPEPEPPSDPPVSSSSDKRPPRREKKE